jgi:hypothetical protein
VNDDTAAIAAVTAARATARYVLLATKRHATVTAATGDDFYFDPVDKHDLNLLMLNNQEIATAQHLKQKRARQKSPRGEVSRGGSASGPKSGESKLRRQRADHSAAG